MHKNTSNKFPKHAYNLIQTVNIVNDEALVKYMDRKQSKCELKAIPCKHIIITTLLFPKYLNTSSKNNIATAVLHQIIPTKCSPQVKLDFPLFQLYDSLYGWQGNKVSMQG